MHNMWIGGRGVRIVDLRINQSRAVGQYTRPSHAVGTVCSYVNDNDLVVPCSEFSIVSSPVECNKVNLVVARATKIL